jgi:hypothetical protein
MSYSKNSEKATALIGVAAISFMFIGLIGCGEALVNWAVPHFRELWMPAAASLFEVLPWPLAAFLLGLCLFIIAAQRLVRS